MVVTDRRRALTYLQRALAIGSKFYSGVEKRKSKKVESRSSCLVLAVQVFLKVHVNVKWQKIYIKRIYSLILLNLQEMIGDFSLTVMNYINWLNCTSIELFSVAFGVEWD